jgi:cellulose synthase/poly-beta-1,6-N-acetylglucosamine synthase-like glycosyltransferase
METTDQTFHGLYHWNLFDAALLIPYFLVMFILAIYGVHRYTLCYLYFKYRKNAARAPLRCFEELPHVTVQLPIFNEQFVIDRLIEAICSMEYPKDKLAIQVLDDSTDETQQVAVDIVARYAALGHPIASKRALSTPGSK